jgi:hypothetical protein
VVHTNLAIAVSTWSGNGFGMYFPRFLIRQKGCSDHRLVARTKLQFH